MLQRIVRVSCKKHFLTPKPVNTQPKAGIKGRAARGGPLVRPKPFPYKEQDYNVWRAFFDKTTWRFDENSKIIVVEGPIASGKTDFAKTLAEELDMKYLRAVTMSDKYVNSYGFDIRQLDDQLPENARTCDEKKFLEHPNNINVANFQINMLQLKYSQYIDALSHLLNTGQGVVIERSCFSDQVFIEAMYKAGYVSKGARKVYYSLRTHTIPLIHKPHLVIYLDVPVSKVQENIQKRSIQYEVKSKVLTPKYLADIETAYKEIHLPEISKHAELLVYDWSEGGDAEVVVEDIERIDFDRFERHDKKLYEWRYDKEWDICEHRIMYTSEKNKFMDYFHVPHIDVPELLHSGDDEFAMNKVYESAPGNKFAPGFNEDMGDKNLLFKTKGGTNRWLWT